MQDARAPDSASRVVTARKESFTFFVSARKAAKLDHALSIFDQEKPRKWALVGRLQPTWLHMRLPTCPPPEVGTCGHGLK